MRSPQSTKSFATVLLATLLLAMIQSDVLGQVDEIPETVLVTPSRIRGVTSPPPFYPGQDTRLYVPLTDDEIRRLAQLTDDELRARVRDVSIRQRWGTFSHAFLCDGSWAVAGALIPKYGVYSIRDNQVCVEEKINGSANYCFKLFRNETGELFSELESRPLGIRPLDATGVETCVQR